MFAKLKEEIVERFEIKLKEQNDRIEILDAKIAMQENLIKNLETMNDNNEQYSRRSCLRIHGIEMKNDEENKKDVGNNHMLYKSGKCKATGAMLLTNVYIFNTCFLYGSSRSRYCTTRCVRR